MIGMATKQIQYQNSHTYSLLYVQIGSVWIPVLGLVY